MGNVTEVNLYSASKKNLVFSVFCMGLVIVLFILLKDALYEFLVKPIQVYSDIMSIMTIGTIGIFMTMFFIFSILSFVVYIKRKSFTLCICKTDELDIKYVRENYLILRMDAYNTIFCKEEFKGSVSDYKLLNSLDAQKFYSMNSTKNL